MTNMQKKILVELIREYGTFPLHAAGHVQYLTKLLEDEAEGRQEIAGPPYHTPPPYDVPNDNGTAGCQPLKYHYVVTASKDDHCGC